ncbi:MAG TPA: DUF488 domain-containing protein [Anaerolineae bacterium]|nr:DUF488 domain-containing protein [Anaerolineae bacterium]
MSKEPARDRVQIFSIGHSDHTIEAFLDLLRQQMVAVVVDVRSQPYSRWAPQFNRESLARDLKAAGVCYVFMGDSLGGRPADPAFYDAHRERPDYERLAQSPAYQAGIEQLLELAEAQRAVMMCSEGDYQRCHRDMLITPTLLKCGARVLHICRDGTVVEAQPQPKQLGLL